MELSLMLEAEGYIAVWEIVLRLIISTLAGALVGYERKRRQKEAGIRTHSMVALGAAMFTIVSKYGFLDIIIIQSAQVDVSRVAANVVTGVCFLGAGMIFVRSKSITGLTTAAGIWAVSAIGLSFGAGLYLVGVTGTLLIVLVQYVLHKPLLKLEGPSIKEITCTIADQEVNLDLFTNELKKTDPAFYYSTIEKRSDGSAIIKFNIHATQQDLANDLYSFMNKYDYIKSISI